MIIEELPGNLILRDYNKKELISYALSFFSEKKKRIENIVNLISGELKIDKSELDFSEKSLVIIDKWLINNVETVHLTPEEYDAVRKFVSEDIAIYDWKFSCNLQVFTQLFSEILHSADFGNHM